MRRWVLSFSLFLLPCALPLRPASGEAEEGVTLLEVASVGMPGSPAIRPEGREVNALCFFHGRLWVGCGDATDNTGPTPVLALDPESGQITREFVVDDEGIYGFGLLGGRLVIPGYDATESWEWGNLYVLEETGWQKRRTLPRAVHVTDVCEFAGGWFAATGAAAEFAEGQSLYPGTIQLSVDAGSSWRTVWSTPADTLSFWRVGSLVPFRGGLYAFPFAVGTSPLDAVPERYRAGLGKPLQGAYYLYRPDPLGAADAVCFDRRSWRLVDLVPEAEVCRVRTFVFRDRLLISALHGEYVGTTSTYVEDERALPPGLTTALYAFDGRQTTRVPLEYDSIRDAVARDGALRLLVLARGTWWVVETADLESFRWSALPLTRFAPRALEYAAGSYWIGTLDGNLFRTVGSRELPSLGGVSDHGPLRLFVSGNLPRNAHAGWLAVARFQRPWREAGLVGEIGEGRIRVSTTEVAAFRLFPPRAALGNGGAVVLEVDGAPAFDGRLPPGRSLQCTRTDAGWSATVVQGDAEGYEPEEQVLARCPARVGKEALARWASEALVDAVGGDVVLLPVSLFRGEMSEGPVSSRDLLDLLHRNRVAGFRATGAEIERMLAFNGRAEARWRLARYPATGAFDPAREYRVLVTDYVTGRAEQFLGRALDAEPGPVEVHEVLLRRLAEVGPPGPAASDG